MQRRTKILLSLAALGTTIAALTVGGDAMFYESAYQATPVGTIEVKELPPALNLVAATPGDYFPTAGAAFMKLFRYIRRNGVRMTVPVEADVTGCSMRFCVGRGRAAAAESLRSADDVRVEPVAARTVVAVGLRGSYTDESFRDGVVRLRTWLAEHPEYVAGGEPYAVYWNGPYVPGFLKRSEVHLPVVAR